jgi:hypothetical protein
MADDSEIITSIQSAGDLPAVGVACRDGAVTVEYPV